LLAGSVIAGAQRIWENTIQIRKNGTLRTKISVLSDRVAAEASALSHLFA